MSMSIKTQNRLNSRSWFHGTTLEHFYNIKQNGLDVEYNKGLSRDFGFGFYMTNKEKSAQDFVRKTHPDGTDALVIMKYDFHPMQYFQSTQYKTICFQEYDNDFAEFVLLNRSNSNLDIQQHSYDMIYGVMSDGGPDVLVLRYKAGEISKEAAIEGLKTPIGTKQLSIHNQEICNTLTLVSAYIYDPNNPDNRKELDVL